MIISTKRTFSTGAQEANSDNEDSRWASGTTPHAVTAFAGLPGKGGNKQGLSFSEDSPQRSPTMITRSRPWLDRAWLILCLLFATVWCVTASAQLSATFDEPNYVSNGLEGWRSGSYKLLMRQGTMPLPVDAISLPLYVWEKWRGVPFRIGSDSRSNPILLDDLALLLPWARLGTLIFAWLLIVYGWLLGTRLAGGWGGRLAALLLATEPSILAHSTLATTDVAITACMVALVYHFDRGREQPWMERVALPGLWYGLAILSKASALVFAPLCLVSMELFRLTRHPAQNSQPPGTSPVNQPVPTQAGLSSLADPNPAMSDGNSAGDTALSDAHDRSAGDAAASVPNGTNPCGDWRHRLDLFWQRTQPFRRDLMQIIVIALVITFVYVRSDFQPEASFVKWAETLGDSGGGRALQWLAQHLRIFTNAGEGLVQQVKHNVRGHGVYLLGHVYPRSVWYYFPVVLSIKLAIPLLLAPLLALAFHPKSLGNWALICALVLLAFSITYRVQIGIRLILPLVALLAVGLAASLSETARALAGWKRRLVVTGIIAGMLWVVISAVRVWPQGLCYANELWGGTREGYLRLSDSNYDWGQGLKELDRWRRDHGLAAMDLWHFGLDPEKERPPFHFLPLHLMEVAGPQDIGPLMKTDYLAVGTTLLYGSSNYAPLQQAAAVLRGLQPVGRTMTHFIYVFPKHTQP